KDFCDSKEQFWILTKQQPDPPESSLHQLIKSVIECLGTKIGDEQIDISVEWLWTCGLISLDDGAFTDSTQLLDVITPYLSERDSVQIQRNICIILSIL